MLLGFMHASSVLLKATTGQKYSAWSILQLYEQILAIWLQIQYFHCLHCLLPIDKVKAMLNFDQYYQRGVWLFTEKKKKNTKP